MSEHAKLSPSHAVTWMSCPGSMVLSEGMPNKSSEHAELGTRTHALAEAILRGQPFEDKDGMLEHAMVYVKHVRSLVEVDVK